MCFPSPLEIARVNLKLFGRRTIGGVPSLSLSPMDISDARGVPPFFFCLPTRLGSIRKGPKEGEGRVRGRACELVPMIFDRQRYSNPIRARV